MGIREFVLKRAKLEGEAIGIQKGIHKRSFEIVTNLLTMTDFTTDE